MEQIDSRNGTQTPSGGKSAQEIHGGPSGGKSAQEFYGGPGGGGPLTTRRVEHHKAADLRGESSRETTPPQATTKEQFNLGKAAMRLASGENSAGKADARPLQSMYSQGTH